MTSSPGAQHSHAPLRREMWGHLLVGAVACALTVSIGGSLAYLGVHYYRYREDAQGVRDFIVGLESRSPSELDYLRGQLEKRPGVARRVLPALLAAARREGSERRQLAAVSLCRAFVNEPRVAAAMKVLRQSRSESVAARAVDSLRQLTPAARAADALVECADAPSQAVADVVCVGLSELGDAGADKLNSIIDTMDVERRIWLAGLLAERPGSSMERVADKLLADATPRVRSAAVAAVCAVRGRAALPILARRLDDRDAGVRAAVLAGVAQLTGKSFESDERGVAAAKEFLRSSAESN